MISMLWSGDSGGEQKMGPRGSLQLNLEALFAGLKRLEGLDLEGSRILT